MNIARIVLSALLPSQERIALAEQDRYVTRGALLRTVSQRCTELTREGVREDDFVVSLCGRGSDFWVDLLALWVIGAKPVCLEPTVTSEHAEEALRLTSATHICHGTNRPEYFQQLAGIGNVTYVDPDSRRVDDLDELPFVPVSRQPAGAGLIFTSGTTGLPKGVPLSHSQLTANALGTMNRLRLRRDDTLMIATPFRFISSISHFLVAQLSGSTFVGIEDKLMVKDLLDLLSEFSVTAFGGSPFHLHFIAQAGAGRLPNIRWAMSSGDHLPVQTIDALRAGFPHLELHVVYGMAEMAGRICTLPPEDLHAKAGSVGHPIAGTELVVRSESGRPAAENEIGDIYVRGHFAFQGYRFNPEANAAVLSDIGFRTGDKGYLDPDGFLFLAGRSDSVFKRSGLKVSAQVITDALLELGTFSDAWVGSVPDELQGRVPVAYVSLGPEGFDQSEVLRSLRNTLKPNHLPTKFVEVDEIPRTGSGKVDRRALAAKIESADESS